MMARAGVNLIQGWCDGLIQTAIFKIHHFGGFCALGTNF